MLKETSVEVTIRRNLVFGKDFSKYHLHCINIGKISSTQVQTDNFFLRKYPSFYSLD